MPEAVGVAVVLPVAAGDASCPLELSAPSGAWGCSCTSGAFTCVLGKGRLVDSPQEFLTRICSCTPEWHFTGLEGFSVRGILPVEARVFCIYFQVFHIYNYGWKLDSQQAIYLRNDYSYNV